MDKNEAINIVRKYRTLLKDYLQFEKMYLYGSYVKGENRENSDIDVAIVVNQLEGDFMSVVPMLWKLRRQIDDRIEPFIIEKDYDKSGFLSEVQKHGIEIK